MPKLDLKFGIGGGFFEKRLTKIGIYHILKIEIRYIPNKNIGLLSPIISTTVVFKIHYH